MAPVAKEDSSVDEATKSASVAPDQPKPAVAADQPKPAATPDQLKPAVPADPVVGEVVSPSPLTTSESAGVIDSKAAQMQEQLESAKAEKEKLLERLGAAEEQMGKMEEQLRLKTERIKQLEQFLQKSARDSEKTASAEVKAPQQPATAASQPEEENALLDPLPKALMFGLVGLAALLLLDLLIGRLRRRRKEAQAQAAPVIRPEPQVAPMVPVADAETPTSSVTTDVMTEAAVSGAVAGTLAEEKAAKTAIDPVQSALDEADIMQAYGLYDRAREVLEEAIARMPEADVLQARRVRLLHEMGARDEFLRAAEAYRARHPAKDDPHWAAIEAIGRAAYPDAPLFGGAGVLQYATPADPLAPAANEKGSAFDLSFDLPEVGAKAVPERDEWKPQPTGFSLESDSSASPSEADELTLELAWSPASESVDASSAKTSAQEQPLPEKASIEPLSLDWPSLELGEARGKEAPQSVELKTSDFDLQPLALEPAVMEAPSLEPAARETPVVPGPASPEVLPMPAADTPVPPGNAAEGAISEDDLRLLGLDEASIDLDAQLLDLDLASLTTHEEPPAAPPLQTADPIRAVVEEPAAPSEVIEGREAPTDEGVNPRTAVSELTAGASPTPAAAILTASFDERLIKLDMAQALVELGDLEGARGTLEEIISTGNDELSMRARELLERIAA